MCPELVLCYSSRLANTLAFIMAEVDVEIQSFVRTGRTGRRNAMPDVLSEKHANVSTAGLAEVLDSINFGASTSGQSCQSSKCDANSQEVTSQT